MLDTVQSFFEGIQETVIYYYAAWSCVSHTFQSLDPNHEKQWVWQFNSPCLPILHPQSAPCMSQEVQQCMKFDPHTHLYRSHIVQGLSSQQANDSSLYSQGGIKEHLSFTLILHLVFMFSNPVNEKSLLYMVSRSMISTCHIPGISLSLDSGWQIYNAGHYVISCCEYMNCYIWVISRLGKMTSCWGIFPYKTDTLLTLH